jgi:hypothetical protein
METQHAEKMNIPDGVNHMKNITFKNIPDNLYYKVVEWKGKLRCATWQDFLEKVIFVLEESEDTMIIEQASEKT